MIDSPAIPPTPAVEAALNDWEASALQDITLPSGKRVRVAPGSLTELMVRGIFPEPLMQTFLDSREDVSAEGAPVTGSEARAGLDLMRLAQDIAAAAVKFVWHEEAWHAVTLDPERFGRLPIADQVAIRRVALGDAQLAEVGLPGLAAFRDLPKGDGAGGDGQDVRPATVEPARPNRTARRARPRSDARR